VKRPCSQGQGSESKALKKKWLKGDVQRSKQAILRNTGHVPMKQSKEGGNGKNHTEKKTKRGKKK